jgi:hypothetical protein
VNLDRATFERVDLRETTGLGLRNTMDFSGCLITPLQAQAMALELAHSLGMGLEDQR